MALAITHLYNHIIETGIYPECLKTSRIIPIEKPGKDKDQLDSYRPINNMHPVDKILESIIKDQLEEFINLQNLIPEKMHGCRKHHNVITAKLDIDE